MLPPWILIVFKPTIELWERDKKRCMGVVVAWKKMCKYISFRAAALVEYEYQIALCNDRKCTSTFLLLFLSKKEIYTWGIGTIRFCKGLRLLSSHRKGTLVTLRTAINTYRLCGNIACCTVAFASVSTIPIFFSKQIVYWLKLADYQLPIQFKVKHLRVIKYFFDICLKEITEQKFFIITHWFANNSHGLSFLPHHRWGWDIFLWQQYKCASYEMSHEANHIYISHV